MLLAVAFVLFLIGISIPGTESPVHIAVVVTAIAIGFAFYLRVFWEVLTTAELNQGERTLWIIAIVCLPMIGNMLYVIIHNASASKQVPKADV